ncbi:30S ribosomal protein S6 [Candidatus Gracilibacteria bacterium]|nr:30S ribosomal protein S6 [bacterium]NDK19949.1 30S ribosomal protein S6 [Candidatus Gracilibacteria bacterium]OIO77534.1 MAG: 30S ribosomal protein S6 [Candidatus Gracilibacteria bacterium CG1_02_38_174]PIQ11165.1 MAG: 30S ribosomal protein S6 [Candidatus Gracilibacteria bacterium CG18_big_fil_WC_8_21_14_2_50_38_16]PIQ40917.1 MAG: 30S ribosomal protein S6 [Candidatus Gracilibacteria bacterium CG12_big_fil_rev_8_21_14_0_65_38_15]PIZ01442.1 MAG: 30S ribosomal protein S6 [Candidatus Gracilibac
MRKYELMLILNPELGDAGAATLLGEVKAELTAVGAKVEKEDIWGVKDIAYKIRNSKTGYYALYNLVLEKGDFFAATKAFNLKKDIWRHMFVRLEDAE